MQTEPPQADPPKPKRRRFQFSLRSLLIFVTLAAVACGYIGHQFDIVRERWREIRKIGEAGGRIGFQGDIIEPLAAGPRSIPFVRRWIGDRTVVAIFVVEVKTTDEDRQRINELFPEATLFELAENW